MHLRSYAIHDRPDCLSGLGFVIFEVTGDGEGRVLVFDKSVRFIITKTTGEYRRVRGRHDLIVDQAPKKTNGTVMEADKRKLLTA
jgi:hypothetical protein